MQLLVEIRRLDLGEQMAGLDLRADVGLPALQVAADARIDRRARDRPRAARQLERRAFAPDAGGDDGDGRHSPALRSIRCRRASADCARRDARGDDDDRRRSHDGDPVRRSVARDGAEVRTASGGTWALRIGAGAAFAVAAVHDAEDDRNEEQRRDGRETGRRSRRGRAARSARRLRRGRAPSAPCR